jgi:phage-related protein
MDYTGLKPVFWIGSTKDDLSKFPNEVKEAIGFALYEAQCGGKHADTKPLRGFGGAGVLEVMESYRGDAYRSVYTVKLKGRLYVLHAFQKKSKKGIATPQGDIELIKQRLKEAEGHYAETALATKKGKRL